MHPGSELSLLAIVKSGSHFPRELSYIIMYKATPRHKMVFIQVIKTVDSVPKLQSRVNNSEEQIQFRMHSLPHAAIYTPVRHNLIKKLPLQHD